MSNNNFSISNSKIGNVTGSVQGEQIINQNFCNKEDSYKTLDKAVTEIQKLITQLQSNNLTQDMAEAAAAQKLASEAKKNSSLYKELVNWGKSLANKSSEEAGKIAAGKVAEAVIIKTLTILGLSVI